MSATVNTVTDQDLVAENRSLREQLVALTHKGHELISTQIRMQSLLHNATDAIIQFDADATIVAFNRAAERIFGYTEIELMYQGGDHLFRFPGGYVGDAPTCLARFSDETADQYATPLVGLKSDGTACLLEAAVAQINSDDLVLFDDFSDDAGNQGSGFEAVLCILHDITERKAVDAELLRHRDELEELVAEQVEEIRLAKDEAERANAAKTDFLASMSHELRTPLHAIVSYSEFGQRKFDSAPRENLGQYFARIKTAGNRLVEMINDLLDLAKAEAGRLLYVPGQHDLAEVLQEVCDEFHALIERNGQRLVTKSLVLGSIAEFDRERVGQVIRNFLSNATNFTPIDRQIAVYIDETTLRNGRAGLRLTVSDQGVGIPDIELDSVFERYVQSSHAVSKTKGTGLGLAIAREIIHGHGGEIGASNNADGGADFVFVLPIVYAGEHE